MIQRIKKAAKKKSVIAAMSIVAVTGTIVGVQSTKAPEPTRYVMEAVSRGSVIATVSGSGQVYGESQIDLKPSVSGDVVAVLIRSGEEVSAGTPLFEIDRSDAVKAVRDANLSVRDAELSLVSANLSLQKLEDSADNLDVIKAEHTLNQAMRSLEDLQSGPDEIAVRQAEAAYESALRNTEMESDGKTPKTVRIAYDDAVAVFKSTVQSLKTSLSDADEILGIDNIHANDDYESYLGLLKSSAVSNATVSYYIVRDTVNDLIDASDAMALTGTPLEDVDAGLEQVLDALDEMEILIRDVEVVLAYTPESYALNQNQIDALKTSMQSNRTSMASKATAILSEQRSVDQARVSFETADATLETARLSLEKAKRGADAGDIATAEERVAEARAALDKLVNGTDDTDIAVAKNTVAQRESSLEAARNRLSDAQEELNDYTVRAPFDGIITGVEAHVADPASPSTVLATIVTKSKVAKITLNEVDIAKIKVGQKVTMAFDAVPDITIAGVVGEVDAVGTAEQGVVGFGITIAFTTDDERILPGMSVSASIIADSRMDALVVSNGALKSYGSGYAVQTLPDVSAEDAASPEGVTSETDPELVPVETGLADDQNTEILSGISEGMYIITRIIQSTAEAVTSASNGTGVPGVGGLSGGNMRFIGR